MSTPVSENHPLRRLFAGLVESVLYCELGMCEPKLAHYLVELLTQFTHIDRCYILCNRRGRRLEEVAEMLTDAYTGENVKGARRDRLVHKHIGDYTLFWSGVYPESLRKLRGQHRKDHLIDYLQQGKRSYAIASELSGEESRPPAEVLRRLSENFEFCVYGLGLVRRGWERLSPQMLEQHHRRLHD